MSNYLTELELLGPVYPPTDVETAAICRMVADQPDAADLLDYFFGKRRPA